MRRLTASCLFLPLLAQADFNPPRWRYRRPVPAIGAAQVGAVSIGPEICAHAAPGLLDLRVVRDRQEVPFVLDRGPGHQTFALQHPRQREDAATRTTVVVLDLGAPLPHDRVRLRVSTRWFHRAVDTDSSSDGRDWRTIDRSVIYRLPGQESLTTSFDEVWDRYVRLRIFNRDDLPLGIEDVAVEATEIRVKFLPAGRGQYWLYYGNPKARAPHYDLRSILDAQAYTGTVALAAGSEEQNPAWRPIPLPWTERHPELLYAALAAAILALGGSTVRYWLRLK